MTGFISFADLRAACLDLPAGDDLAATTAARRDAVLTKPPGSLGRLEDVVVWLARWQGRAVPRLDREPLPHIPFVAFQMERRGLRSEIAERIRERYRARVQARQSRSQGLDPETLRRQAREAWLQLRDRAAAQPHADESMAERRRAGRELERDAADRDFAL